MKRILMIMLALSSVIFSLSAQSGLNIEKFLGGKYASDPQVTETFISGKGNKFLEKHKLRVFATFKGPSAKYEGMVEALVMKDAATAIGKNIRYKNGKLYYGLFSLAPVVINKKKIYRYLYYLNKGVGSGKNLMVVYFEGNLNEEEALRLIQSIRTK
ncbi:MAG: hypothetical protein K2J82_09760 [Muribaculaceae bacterium]|nr:hypothetical protein [Muribaculaceae bacterium]MDE6754880.1 hypothetical protein [Muribaculaceae bacterium]